MEQIEGQDIAGKQTTPILLFFGHNWPLRWGLFVLNPGYGFPQFRGPMWESEAIPSVPRIGDQGCRWVQGGMVWLLTSVTTWSGAVFGNMICPEAV